MGHHHDHHSTDYNKAFLFGIILNVAFIAIELFYGFIANSSALIADAGHNTSDVLGLLLAWFAIWLAAKKPRNRFSYGYKKSTILISLLNAVLLFGAVVAIAWEAIHKFKNPEPVGGTQVMIVAGIGVVINTITALLFFRGQKHDLNIKGAFLHMAADAAVSLGVVIAGLVIKTTGILWIDPLMSLIIVLVIIWSTWSLFIESINLALDAAPRHIDIQKVEDSLLAIEQVEALHDLHVWALSTNENSLSVHLISSTDQAQTLLAYTKEMLANDFNLHHTTIQIESNDQRLNCHNC